MAEGTAPAIAGPALTSSETILHLLLTSSHPSQRLIDTMAALSIEYHLNPPPETPTPASLSPSQDIRYPISEDPAAGHKAYYEKLRAEVLQAKSTLGEQLTAWRDAVGKREDKKEAKIPQHEDEDEEEDEEE